MRDFELLTDDAPVHCVDDRTTATVEIANAAKASPRHLYRVPVRWCVSTAEYDQRAASRPAHLNWRECHTCWHGGRQPAALRGQKVSCTKCPRSFHHTRTCLLSDEKDTTTEPGWRCSFCQQYERQDNDSQQIHACTARTGVPTSAPTSGPPAGAAAPMAAPPASAAAAALASSSDQHQLPSAPSAAPPVAVSSSAVVSSAASSTSVSVSSRGAGLIERAGRIFIRRPVPTVDHQSARSTTAPPKPPSPRDPDTSTQRQRDDCHGRSALSLAVAEDAKRTFHDLLTQNVPLRAVLEWLLSHQANLSQCRVEAQPELRGCFVQLLTRMADDLRQAVLDSDLMDTISIRIDAIQGVRGIAAHCGCVV